MKTRHVSRVAALSICVILLLSFAEVVEPEPFGLHLDSDGKPVLLNQSDIEPHNFQVPESVPARIRSLPADGPCAAIVAMLPGPSPRRSGPMDAGSLSLAPDEAGPRFSTVQRI